MVKNTMRTVGQMLKERRTQKGLTLEQVESATKIRLKFLRAIEADEYNELPSLAYAKGFVKNYGEYMGFSSTELLAFFRRQTREVPKSSLLPKTVSSQLTPSWLRLTPARFIGGIIVTLALLFMVYLVTQYRHLHAPPRLTIITPLSQEITREKRIDVTGVTDPDSTLTINGTSTLVRSDGKFFDQIPLNIGVNTITITATSRYGKATTIVREVGYQQQ